VATNESNRPVAKWVVMWNLPADTDIEQWETWYWEQHVPLAQRMPHQIRYVTSKTVRRAYGAGYYRIAEQYFPTVDLLEEAIASPAGVAVAEDAGPFVTDPQLLVTIETEVSLDCEG
jgi:uncharacterized protein (TIGR02118 family)